MKKQGSKSETSYKRNIQIAAPIFFIFIIMTAMIWGIAVLKNPKTLPFRHVKISANNNHIEMAVLQQVVVTHLKGGFFSLGVDQLRQALLTLPWVADVSFRRVWPDQLMIDIEEQHAIARWGDQVVNAKGQLFQPSLSSIPKGLPYLSGPIDSLKEILERYHQFSPALLTINVTLSELSLTERHAWDMVLNGHINVMLGRDDVDHRFKRLLSLYPRIIGARGQDVAKIDLRYPNGLSVKWNPKKSQVTLE
ncbi:cell division protein FtsQ/DivIB [Candidiatus Paracoxiella cheracis]|uniref:cell division protein FtsQ/DivIB n=1 Tax=Candidiatus Paracoxiella cheracis TaxID=3405120 RepID=UPI003BF4D7F7